MKHDEALSFLKNAQFSKGKPQRWLDLGCGGGTFTYALAALLPAGSEIIAVDMVPQKLQSTFQHSSIRFIQADFTTELLPVTGIDGIFMANALHYVAQQKEFLEMIERYFSAEKQFLIVEYERDDGNKWVPFPVTFIKLKKLFSALGYVDIQKLNERPSAYGQGNMYLAQIS